jgi:hypothetical protein
LEWVWNGFGMSLEFFGMTLEFFGKSLEKK